jgi:hypothetical protein
MKLIIGITLIIIIIILIYRALKTTEHFRNVSDKLSGYEQFANEGLVFGNPLIQRDGLNIEIMNFGMNSNKMDIILNSTTPGLTALANNGTVKISLMKSKRITAIRTKGLSKFQILTSMDDTNYENIVLSTASSFINLTNPTTTEILTLENLVNISNSKPSIAKYVKIINTNSENATDVKVEIYGVESSSVSNKVTLQSGTSLNVQLYDEKAKLLTTGIYISEEDNNNPFLLIKMPENYDHLVNFISFKSNIAAFKIKYGHSQNNNVYSIPCNGTLNGNVNENINEYFYFPNPTMLNYITIIPIMSITKPKSVFKITEISVFGTLINPSDNKAKYLDSSAIICNTLIENFANNLSDPYSSITQLNNSDILNNIKTTQNLCKILETQDKISNQKIMMERNKQYLLTLQQLNDDITSLESQIKKLEDTRTARINNNDAINLVRYQNQKGEEAKVADLVSQRLAAQEKLAVNLNFMTASTPTPMPTTMPTTITTPSTVG